MRKTDLHCHILPELDDGSHSWAESLEMVRLAAEQGFEAVIATPHASSHFPEHSPMEIIDRCTCLERRVRRTLRQDFRVFPGQEILYSDETPQRLLQGELLTLNHSRYVLIEFPPNILHSSLLQGVESLRMAGYRPVVAHVERYAALYREGALEELRRAGALLQMNYRSLEGRWYQERCAWSRRMLKQKQIHLLGTDMHNAKDRSPSTARAEQWMKGHLDGSYIQDLTYKNARRILKNEAI